MRTHTCKLFRKNMSDHQHHNTVHLNDTEKIIVGAICIPFILLGLFLCFRSWRKKWSARNVSPTHDLAERIRRNGIQSVV